MVYDALIVGASVSGLYTGYRLAQAGWKVRILDRRHEVGVPVRCGEATGNRAELRRFVPVDESWICRDIRGIAVHVGATFTMSREIPDTGMMLHRDRFEQSLAALARNHEAEISLGTSVVGLEEIDGAEPCATLDDGTTVSGRVIIGADGVESKVGRWAGITRPLDLDESFPSAQYRVRSDFCNDGFLHFFVGSDVVPRGYLWVFPRSENEISVGAGFYGCHEAGSTVVTYLDRFIAHRIGKVTRDKFITGCVPLALCPRVLYRGRVVVVGDAARQCNPLTAGGIMNSLEAADLLTGSLITLGPSRPIGPALSRYSQKWRGAPRFNQKAFGLLLRIFLASSDAQITKAIKLAERIFGGSTDRSRPFSLPVIPFVRLAMYFFPRAVMNLRILFQ
jgi:digeranylgeranylglycerophospholipid reductase